MQTTKSDITKNILATSAKKLLKHKTITKISIKELVSESGLNRQTFYYHFKDIYDLVYWIFRTEVLAVFKDYEGEALWQVGLKKLLIYINENKDICQNTLNSLGRDQISHFYYEEISKLVIQAIDSLVDGIDIDINYKKRITQYFAISFGSIIEQWTFGRIDQSIDELIVFLDRVIQDQIAGNYLRLQKVMD